MTKKILFCLFSLTVFSLPFANIPSVVFGGQRLQLTEPLFLLTAAVFALALLVRVERLRPGWLNLLLIGYLGTQAFSVLFSEDVRASSFKLLGIAYLVCLAGLSYNLFKEEKTAKPLILTWIAAALAASAYSVFVLLGFYIDGAAAPVAAGLSHYGTFPVGDYPRIQSVFANPNMFCHYLGISWMLLLLAYEMKWIGTTVSVIAAVVMAVAVAFTLSPGIGAVVLGTGLWYYAANVPGAPRLKKAVLALTVLVAVFFVGATMVKVDKNFQPLREPSARILTWSSAARNFLDHPFTGKGPGTGAADVRYGMQHLTDAHNMYLNVLSESGIPAAAMLTALGIWLLVKLRAAKTSQKVTTVSRALGIAFFAAFFYQGITGSYEDARHLWVLAGLAGGIASADFGGMRDE